MFLHNYRYAADRISRLRAQNRLTSHSRFQKWKPVSREEMYGFLALIINMGIIQLPDIESYWKTSWISEVPFFGRVMPRDRFQEIFWLLHISSVDPDQPPRKIDKVRDLLDLLLPRYREYYTPTQNISIDETMVGFRGRFGSTQYMPQKPTKWGIKAFTMADGANGYMLNVLVYTGAQTLEGADSRYESLPVPGRVVMDVIEPYLDKGYHCFTDRYYSSVPLVQALQERQTTFTGTIMKNRADLPDPIRLPSFRLGGGEVVSYRCDRMMVLAWRAESKKKPLIMITSSGAATMVEIHPRRVSADPVLKPSVVDTYNHSMNGVDVADQMTVFYSFVRKTLKWWRKIFFWLLEVSIVNSYILHKLTSTPKSHLDFRRAIVEEFAAISIQQTPPRPRPGRPRKRLAGDPERLNQQPHFLAKRPANEQRDCLVCSDRQRGVRRRSLYYCRICQDNPTLCPDICFERYHTLRDYKLHVHPSTSEL